MEKNENNDNYTVVGIDTDEAFMKPLEPKMPVCSECKSDLVLCDAFAEWNPDTQRYELSNNYDEWICNSEKCKGETTGVDWIPYDASIETFPTPCGSMTSEQIAEHIKTCEVCATEHAETPLDLYAKSPRQIQEAHA